MKCYVDLSCHVVIQVTLMWHVVVMQVTLMWHVVVMQVTLMWHVVIMQVTLMWHVVVMLCVFKLQILILTFICILYYRDPVPKRGNLHALLPVTISPHPIQYRLGILYILTGGDVIEISCLWNFIDVLCLDTSETFSFWDRIFFLFLFCLSLSFTYPHNGIEWKADTG